MRFTDDDEENGFSTPVIYTILVVSALVLVILGVVLASNNRTQKKIRYAGVSTPSPVVEQQEEYDYADADFEKLYKDHKLRSEDLDFWDMYRGSSRADRAEREEQEELQEVSPSPSLAPKSSAEPTEEELAADGKHIQVSYKDGTTKWLKIDESLPVNDYDYTKLKTVNGKMTYYDGNKKLSRLGVSLSEENGTVDFEALKEAGIDFVMLKVGGRGYGTGLLTLDKNFETNIEAAEKAGLDIGILFSSQAVTVQEATEEAKFVTDQLLLHKITYPVAYYMESIQNDTARTDILDEMQKTEIVEAFMRDIEFEGYHAILYGDQRFLLTEILTSELLKDREVWLTDSTALPEYPYSFKMWEYGNAERVSGVSGEIHYTISFVDYAKR